MAAPALLRGLTKNLLLRSCLTVGVPRVPTMLTSSTVGRAFAVATLRSAAFRAPAAGGSALLAKLPALQQPPHRQSSTGDHVRLWKAERIVTGVMCVAFPVAVMVPSQFVEVVLAFTLVLHGHWGLEALVQDYIRPSLFGAMAPKVMAMAVTFLSLMTYFSLCYFIFTDIGLVNAVQLLWRL